MHTSVGGVSSGAMLSEGDLRGLWSFTPVVRVASFQRIIKYIYVELRFTEQSIEWATATQIIQLDPFLYL